MNTSRSNTKAANHNPPQCEICGDSHTEEQHLSWLEEGYEEWLKELDQEAKAEHYDQWLEGLACEQAANDFPEAASAATPERARTANPRAERLRHVAKPAAMPVNGVAPSGNQSRAPAKHGRQPTDPRQIVERWRQEGPLVRVETGIRPLDEACRGGFAIPWRVLIVGAPAAGKTFVGMCIADTLARRIAKDGIHVGILGVDEEPDDLTVRLAQIAGFTLPQIEGRDPRTLDEIDNALEILRVRFYDAEFTIETAASDLARWAAREPGGRAALFIDSLHAATSSLSAKAKGPRELIEANVAALRRAAVSKRLLVVATAEANRSSYAYMAGPDRNDLAAGAESRALEYAAQTQLVVRTPKGHPNIAHVVIAKNRRAKTGEFWLQLDRDRHAVRECDNPTPPKDPEVARGEKRFRTHERKENDRTDRIAKLQAEKVATQERAAESATRILANTPEISARALRDLVKGQARVGSPMADVGIALARWRLTNSSEKSEP